MSPFNRVLVLLSLAGLSQIAAFGRNSMPERITPVPDDQPVPVVDFARPALFEIPELNPSGTYFAALSKDSNLHSMVIFSQVGGGKWLPTGLEGEYFVWVDDSHLRLNDLYWFANGRLRQSEDRVVDLKHPGTIVSEESVVPQNRVGLIPETGFMRTQKLGKLPAHFDRVARIWHRPQDGEAVFCQVFDDDGQAILFRWADRRWEKSPVDLDAVTVLDCGDKPDELLVIGPAEPGRPRALQRMDAASGQLDEVIYRDPKYDCRGLVFRRGTREIAGVLVPGAVPRVVWLDKQFAAVQELLNRNFVGSVVQIISSDMKRSRFTIMVQSDRQPPIYYLFDAEQKSLGLIQNASPWIDPKRMGATKVLGFKTRDGVILEAFLTLPSGTTKEHPAPLVTTIHGGPWSESELWGWSAYSQSMVAAGYAVLSVNYRGSAGCDSRVPERDRFDFDKMSTDVIDGIHAAIRMGLVDPRRIAVEGYGFGGYLAMRSVLEEPTLFQCAILFGGVYDWQRAFADKDASNRKELLWLKRRLDKFAITPVSVLKRSDEIKIPVFFVRNVRLRDIAVESQIAKLHSALRDKVERVNFGDLNLYTNDEAYAEVVDRITRVRAFLDEHLAPKPTTTAAH